MADGRGGLHSGRGRRPRPRLPDRLFPLSLGSEGTCRIGGNLSTNAGGVNVIRYGMARELVLGLEVVLADGRVWNGLRTLRKDNTGYDLKQLFLGAEGSLGIITAASLRLFARPRERVTLFAGVPSPEVAVTLLANAKDRFAELISSFELMAGGCVDAAAAHLEGVRNPLDTSAPWYVLVELAWSLPDGLAAAAEAWLGDALEAELVLDATIAASEAQRRMLWRMREELSPAMRMEGQIVRNDVSVPVGRLPELIERGGPLIASLVPEGACCPSAMSATATCTSTSCCRWTRPTWTPCASASTTRSATWSRNSAARSAPSTASAGSRPASSPRARRRSRSS